ncbi:GNAT family N-acetyltransferase [Roseibium sp.]|uniref:GNAT family N-acetyltransferase n=1 Tax=Roseibium sp. TaxID=1936156 RepID=UPI003BAD7262
MLANSAGVSGLEVCVFDPLQDDLPLEAWQDLSDVAVDPNPFFGPVYLRAYLRHMGPGNVKLLAVRDSLTGRWLMSAPIRIRPAGVLVPVPTLFTTEYGPVGTPLLHPDAGTSHARRFFETAAGKAGILALPHLPLASGAARMLMGLDGADVRVAESHHRACHDGGPDGQAQFDEAFKGKRRKEMKRLLRRLEDEGPVTLETIGEKALPSRFEQFLELEASGWKGRENTALASQSQTAAFARETVTGAARAGRVRIDELRVGETLIASLVLLVDGGHVFAWKIAFDEAFSRFSPGAQLVLHTFQENLAMPEFTLADSLAIPGHSMIEPLWRGRLEIGTLLLAAGPMAAFKTRLCATDLALEQSLRRLARDVRRKVRS